MISKREWESMKMTEVYGMFCQLKKELDLQKVTIEILELRVDRIGKKCK